MEFSVFAVCQPNSLEESSGCRHWKGKKKQETENRKQPGHMIQLASAVLPATGGRGRCRPSARVLAAQGGTAPPSVWGGAPAPSSGAAGRHWCPSRWTSGPEAAPAARGQQTAASHHFMCLQLLERLLLLLSSPGRCLRGRT